MKTLFQLLVCTLMLASCSSIPKQAPKNDTEEHSKDSLNETQHQIVEVDSFAEFNSIELVELKVDSTIEPGKLGNDTTLLFAMQRKFGFKPFAAPTNAEKEGYLPINDNAFVNTLNLAYDHHFSISLSPDQIWILIAQGIAIHINQKHPKYENVLFKKERPKTIEFRSDEIDFTNPEHWQHSTDSFSSLINKYAHQDLQKLMTPEFSTTTPEITTAFEINYMDACSKTFEFVGGTGCGFPKIQLLGKVSDWKEIQTRLDKLSLVGLDTWALELRPVIQEFINCYTGKINHQFWSRIYKTSSVYGRFSINGWIIKFFPYLKKYEWMPKTSQRTFTFKPNPFLVGKNYLMSDLGTDDFPDGFASVPVKWNIYKPGNNELIDSLKLDYKAGFMACQIDSNGFLSPKISWAVFKQNSKSEKLARFDNGLTLQAPEQPQYLSIMREDSLEDAAIYLPGKNANYVKSLNYFKKELIENLGALPDTLIHIEFVVTYTGEIINIETATTKWLTTKIHDFIKSTEKHWIPAKGRSHGLPREKVPCNFRVQFSI